MTKGPGFVGRLVGALAAFLLLALPLTLAAQTHRIRERSLTEDVGRDGLDPALPVAVGDALYGTTLHGGRYGWGTLYRVGRDGVMQVLHDFGPADAEPVEVTLGDDGALYGVTRFGGRTDGGTLYRYQLDGTYEVLAEFVARTGRFPNALRKNRDGLLYGVTVDAGAHHRGTIFQVGAGNEIEVLYSLDAYGYPNGAPLLASDGKLYGALQFGGSQYAGAVYRLDSNGRFDLMLELGLPPLDDAESAYGPLVQGADGALYGATNAAIWEVRSGYVYRLQLDGQASVFHSFDASRYAEEGSWPNGALALGNDGSLYGGTDSNGPNRGGTLYRIAPDGGFSLLYAFGAAPAGQSPIGVTPLQGDRFAGLTGWGGEFWFGTMFFLTPQPPKRSASLETLRSAPAPEGSRR